MLITHDVQTKYNPLIPKVNEQTKRHHDKSNHSHSRAQKESNRSLKLQFSSEKALECNTEI